MNAASRAAFRANPEGVLISGLGDGCQIARHSGTIQKSGSRVREEEGNALRFASGLSLPVPKVHEILGTAGDCTIRMDFVDGVCLEDAWPSMSAEDKKSIARQLGRILSTMRDAPREHRLIGACGGTARDLRQFTDYTGGPFDNESAFNDFVLDLVKTTPIAIRDCLAGRMQTGHRVVFTHGDLTPRNIIVQDGCLRALIDWEFAGWYPEYWEYVKFFDRPTSCRGWKDLATEIFETPYPSELVTFQVLARWQRP